jgi:spore maturation protein CgeB
MKILCVFGECQYGKKDRGLSTEYFSFIPAFEKLGHEVYFFDSWDRALYNNFIELNNALVGVVKKEKPDVIFSVQLGYEIWLETWDYIRANFKSKTVNWCTDDSWKYYQHSRFLAPHFDLMVTTYEEFLPKYRIQNVNTMLSAWSVPIQWIQRPKEGKKCKYKVSFVGAAHGNRKSKIKELKRMGVKVDCFGYGWENGAIDESEIPKIFNNSIISLNFSNSSGENQIKARVFEVTGSGGFLLTEDAKNLNKILVNDKEISVFTDINHCAKKINYYLDNLALRDELAAAGFIKTVENHTYVNRIKNIICTIQAIKKKSLKSIDFSKAVGAHKKNIFLVVIRSSLLFIGRVIYGKKRGGRFARRIVYEFSWRVFGADTYKSKGIVGRMFYSE